MKKHRQGRKKLIFLSGAVAITVAVGWFLLEHRLGGREIEHVILISIDTCRADYLSCYGYRRQTTPNIDAVAAEGILFRNVVAPVPMTLPAHCSMMTGTIPLHHGVHHNFGHLDDSNVTVAELMRRQGYKTGAIVSAFVLDSGFGLDQGFETYNDRLEGTAPGDRLAERKGEVTTTLALQWLEKNHKKPFFFFLHYFDPHLQYEPPRPFYTKYRDNLYAGEIAFVDHLIGRVIKQLKRLGIYDSALLIITGDHGEGLGEHGESVHSYFIYDSTVKVPLIIKPPGRHVPARIDDVAGLIDIFPTIAKCLKIPVPAYVQGKDLSTYWKQPPGASGASSGPRYMYCESLMPTQIECNPLVGLVGDGLKYIHTTRPELYDLQHDPHEKTNLVTKMPEQALALKKQLMHVLQQHSKVTGDTKLDSQALQSLRSLGYVGAEAVGSTIEFDANRRDAKDLIQFYEKKVKALQFYEAKKFAQAGKLCREMLAIDADIAHPYTLLSEIACMENKVEEGIEFCRRGLALKPNKHDAFKLNYNLAIIFNQQGRFAEAIKHYSDALKYLPDQPEVLIKLADILSTCRQTGLRNPQHAVTLAQRACELTGSKDPTHLAALAAAYSADDRFDLAVETIELAVKSASASGQTKLTADLTERLESYKGY